MNSMFSFEFSCTMWRREICYTVYCVCMQMHACCTSMEGWMDRETHELTNKMMDRLVTETDR